MSLTIPEGTRVLWKESTHRLRTFYPAESFVEPGCKGAFEMRHSFLLFLFVGAHFRILHKFLVHMRTVYTSQKVLPRPLIQTTHLIRKDA